MLCFSNSPDSNPAANIFKTLIHVDGMMSKKEP